MKMFQQDENDQFSLNAADISIKMSPEKGPLDLEEDIGFKT